MRRLVQKNIGFFACLCAACLLIHLSTFEVKAMTLMLEQASSLLKQAAAGYTKLGEEEQLDLQEKLAGLARAGAATDKDLQVLALGAPSEVNLDEHPRLTVLIGSSRTGLRNWQVNFNTNLNLYVRHLASGELRVVQPLVNVRRGIQPLASGKGTPPKESDGRNRTTSVSHVELESLKPGVYVVTAFSHDLRANTLTINAKGRNVVAREEPRAFPLYQQHTLNRSVELPTRIEPRGTAGASGPGLLGIAVQVHAVDGVIKNSAGQAVWQSNLVLVKLDETPINIPIYVPVQEVTGSDGKPAFNAVFAIDWGKTRASQALSNSSDGFQIYLDAGHTLMGPYALRK